MTVQEIESYCQSKPMAAEEYPFGDIPICYKLNGKIFAQIYSNENDYKITLKCTADIGQFYRTVYPGESRQRLSLSSRTAAVLEYCPCKRFSR